jgi:magnesium chelatase subunit D
MINHLPFPALVGLETAQQALLLLAVEPRLRGVVLAAPAGTGKSSLARGWRTLLNQQERPFVELPASADADNLLGGLDLEATLHKGWPVLRPGLLARAHGGVVYVDGINLLTEATANLLLGVLDEGLVRVEREGGSLQTPAHFSLLGTYDPAEGAPRNHLLDRIGLLAVLPGTTDATQRGEVIRRNLLVNPVTWDDEVALLYGLIQAACEQLPQVVIHPAQIELLSRVALQYGVQGHRVDLFAVYAACAAAALALRETVDDEDLQLAIRLVILPRATQIPTPPEQEAPPPPAPEPPPPPDEAPTDQNEEDAAPVPPEQPLEQLLSALASELPETLEELPFRRLRRGRSGSRGSTDAKRGRHVRSLPGDPRRARIDASATLRAAAPWQRLRRAGEAAQHQRAVVVRFGDVRVKQLRSKAGALFCFAVDASGSMALHRMRQAKGAVHALLQKAYINRDRVALIAFRGAKAELLMAPTQSVELARRALDRLPTGGGTPLASALLLACDVAQQARQRGILQTVLILLTDGRANVALQGGGKVKEELAQLGGHIAASALHVVVVDTQRSYLSQGEARQLAALLGGDYAYLPNAQGEQIADLATQVAAIR